jgi:inorganic pyrophosphatase
MCGPRRYTARTATSAGYTMDVSKIQPGKDAPRDINVVIEIPQGSQVKYEVDKDSGAIFVDRFLFTPMAYPAAYGFIPGTLAEDGDPADALVLAPAPVVPGAVIRCRPIGMLQMEDESGQDEKIICVPHDKIHTLYKDVHSIDDLPAILRASRRSSRSRSKRRRSRPHPPLPQAGEGDGAIA